MAIFSIYKSQTDGKLYAYMRDSSVVSDEDHFKSDPDFLSNSDEWVPVTLEGSKLSGEFYATSDHYPFWIEFSDGKIEITEKGFMSMNGVNVPSTKIYKFER